MRRARRERLAGLAHPLDDAGFARTLSNLLAEHRALVLPTAYQLDSAAVVRPADITAAVALWDTAQRQAGTGLEGTL